MKPVTIQNTIQSMKHASALLTLLLALPNAGAQVAPAPPLMNFQGRLAKPDGTPVSDGTHQVVFSLWSAASGGVQKWSQTFPALAVKNGAFATLLNVGTGPADLFSGNLWLQMQIDGAAPLPRQQLATAAYAFKANSVADGSIGAAQIAPGSITAVQLAPGLLGGSGNAWNITGNSGTNPALNFLGTADNQPLLLKANGLRVLGLYPVVSGAFRGSTLIGGYDGNLMENGVVGGVIAGGGYFDTSVNGNYRNSLYDNFGFIGGGGANSCGTNNFDSTDSPFATIGGGFANLANAKYAFVGGGTGNFATNTGSVVTGGNLNNSTGVYSVVGGGAGCSAGSDYTTVSGGFSNFATATDATVGGGIGNGATALAATIAGGFSNAAGGSYASVGGGIGNSAGGLFSVVPGGQACKAMGDYSFAAGNAAKALNQGAFVWADSGGSDFTSAVNNSFIVRAAGGVGINTNNPGGYALNVVGNGNFSGTVTSNGLTLISDARYKTNAQTIPNALEMVLRLRGVTYEWKRSAFPNRNFPAGTQIGFLAQEVAKVLPELAPRDAQGYYSVAYANFAPVLTEAIKEQQREIDALKLRATQAEQENALLRAQNRRIVALEKQMTALLTGKPTKRPLQVTSQLRR